MRTMNSMCSNTFDVGIAQGLPAGRWVAGKPGSLEVRASAHRVEDGAVVNAGKIRVDFIEIEDCPDESWADFEERLSIETWELASHDVDPAWGYVPVFVRVEDAARAGLRILAYSPQGRYWYRADRIPEGAVDLYARSAREIGAIVTLEGQPPSDSDVRWLLGE